MAKQKVSDRTFIDAAGNEVDRMEQATGARYTLVGPGKSFDQQFGDAGTPATMFAIFGFWTKVGNVVNTVLNDDKEPGTADDAANEVQAWLDSVNGGTWRESEAGVRGPKYDNDVLAYVLHAALVAENAAKGDAASYKARLESDKGYRAKVVARDAIKTAYWAEMATRGTAKPAQSLDSLA